MSWWEALSEYLDELERTDGEAPDPWAEVDLGDSTLTDEQVAFLAFPGVTYYLQVGGFPCTGFGSGGCGTGGQEGDE